MFLCDLSKASERWEIYGSVWIEDHNMNDMIVESVGILRKSWKWNDRRASCYLPPRPRWWVEVVEWIVEQVDNGFSAWGEERVVSCRWTSWVRKTIGWSSRVPHLETFRRFVDSLATSPPYLGNKRGCTPSTPVLLQSPRTSVKPLPRVFHFFKRWDSSTLAPLSLAVPKSYLHWLATCDEILSMDEWNLDGNPS